jgi:ADP-ribosylation factor related protein 1
VRFHYGQWCLRYSHSDGSDIESVLSSPQILGVPLLLLANKQDSPTSLTVEEIRHDYEDWHQRRMESARRGTYDDNMAQRRDRIASLDVLGISALEGYVVLIFSAQI